MNAKRSKGKTGYKTRGTGQGPLGFYALLLVAALGVTAIAQILLTASLPSSYVEPLSHILNGLLATLYSWLLAGLAVCLLLLAWLRLKTLGLGLSLLLFVLWLIGLRRHLQSPSIFLYIVPLFGGAATLWFGLQHATRHVLPVFNETQAQRALASVQKKLWGASQPGYILGKDDADTPAAVERRGYVPFVFAGCDQAIATSDKKLRLKGVQGPGLVVIQPDEQIAQVMDVRPQVRSFSLTGRTQDGIQVQVRASVAFRIDAGRREPTLGEPLPFSRAAAFRAILAQRVEHDRESGGKRVLMQRLWDDLPCIRGEHILRDIISKRDFDDLYGPHRLDAVPPRREIAETLFQRLQASLEPIGIQLLDVKLGNIEPVDLELYLKRARNWQTDWIRRVMVMQAEGQVERLQILERARADARTELILEVGRQLENLAQSRARVGPDAVLDQFLVVLETLTTHPEVQDALPERTKELLSDVREAVGE